MDLVFGATCIVIFGIGLLYVVLRNDNR